MTILKHELRQGRVSFVCWTGVIGFLLSVCVFLFPEMKNQMDEIGRAFSSMGSFAAAFGIDKLGIGTFIGYYALECGNILGLGGAFYASMIAVGILSKEEKDKTAEFLMAHPVSRVRIITEKWLSVMIRILFLNALVFFLSAVSIVMIGEELPWRELSLVHAAYLILQMELAGICFGISAFIRKGGVASGIGVATVMYTLNIIANVAKSVENLKYVTPYGYCDGGYIVHHGSLDSGKVLIGISACVIGIIIAYWKYSTKDIH